MVFLQIMHPRTFHIKNPNDAKLASLSICQAGIIEKMACFHVINRKYKKYNISVHILAIFTILVSGHMLEQYRSNEVMTLMFQGQLIAKIKMQRKINALTLKVI